MKKLLLIVLALCAVPAVAFDFNQNCRGGACGKTKQQPKKRNCRTCGTGGCVV